VLYFEWLTGGTGAIDENCPYGTRGFYRDAGTDGWVGFLKKKGRLDPTSKRP
jgi:hypothetical protein